MRTIAGLAMIAAAIPVIASAHSHEKKPVDPNKKACRNDVPTGSMMPKAICHTTAEWQAIDEANAASARRGLDQQNRAGGVQGH